MKRNREVHTKEQNRWLGLFFILLGLGWLLKKLGVEVYPEWLLTWPVALILLGFFAGIKSRFTQVFPFVLMLIGTAVLLKKEIGIDADLGIIIWPTVLIIIGIFILFKPGKHKNHRFNKKCNPQEEDLNTDKLNESNLFCGTKKRVLTKDFKGGDFSAIFGGGEIDLTQADFEQEARIHISIIFGGLKLLVPSNWEIRTELNTIAAGLEDKRPPAPQDAEPEKTLVLTGSMTFGGIEIASY